MSGGRRTKARCLATLSHWHVSHPGCLSKHLAQRNICQVRFHLLVGLDMVEQDLLLVFLLCGFVAVKGLRRHCSHPLTTSS
eukprot:12881483-Prorocentrum_lima.AAC.1